MSFTEKIASIMARPGQDVVPKDDVPWWMRYGGRALGTVGGVVFIFGGVFNCIGIILGDVSCLLAGIWQILAGFIAVCVEAPCCCLFIDYVQTLSDWVENRPYWNKAVGYFGLAIPPLIFCGSITLFFESALIFLTGVIYGMMSLGKKASAEEMRSAAAADSIPKSTSNMRSNLVDNAQPIGFTGAPVFDSNV